MGKLIEGHFGKPRGNAEAGESQFDSNLDLEHLTALLLFLAELRRNDPSSFSPRNLDLRLRNLISASDRELFTWANRSQKSGSGGWQSSPSFYDALIQELRNRDLITPTQP
jgi:hypothetical protein